MLDRVRGTFSVAPPESLTFSPGTAAGVIQVTDGQRVAHFEMPGLGLFLFAGEPQFEPLLAPGASEVYTMMHLYPSHRAWDQLTFYPDGMPHGQDSSRRCITYERD